MQLKRHFLIGEDLDDLERLEEELEEAGMVKPQLHVLTRHEGEADQHNHLHQVVSLMRNEVVRSTVIGACVGVCAAVLVLLVAYFAGWTGTAAGWIPFVFLAVVVLGLFAWEGGLLGIETPNAHFRRFQGALDEGKHVFFVDLEPGQERILEGVVARHPTVHTAGVAGGSQHWIVTGQQRVKRFFTETFP